jgi:hypothetical protein
VVTATLVAVLGLFALAPVAGAQSSTGPVPVTLVSQATFVRANQPFKLTVSAKGAAPTDTVRVNVYATALTSSDLRQPPSTPRGNVTYSRQFAVSDVLESRTGLLVLDVAAEFLPTKAGVYAVAVSVAANRGGLPFVTNLIRLPDTTPTTPPLAVGMIVPVTARVALAPDRTRSLSSLDRTRLAALVGELAGNRSTPFTLAPSAETLEALAATDPTDTTTLASLVTIAAGREVVADTYVPVDDEALRASGLTTLADELHLEARTTTKRLLGQEPDPTIAVLGPTATPDVIAELRQRGVSQVAAPEDHLEELDDRRFRSTPITMAFAIGDAAGQRVSAGSIDPALGRYLAAAGDPVLNAHRLLADLAAAGFEGTKFNRGVIVQVPDEWTPTSAFGGIVLPALAPGANPLFTATSLADWFRIVATAAPTGDATTATLASGPLYRSLQPMAPQSLEDYPDRVRTTASRVASYESFLGGPQERTDALRELLLVSADARLDGDRRRAYLRSVDDTVTAGTSVISGPLPQTVTLSGKQATIPVILANTGDTEVYVRIDLRSDAKLEFPDGNVVQAKLEPRGNNRIDVRVRSRTSGDSPIQIVVSAPDGGLGPLSTGRITVRSTALSGVGLVISVIALAVLLVWWFRTRRAERRQRRTTVRAS